MKRKKIYIFTSDSRAANYGVGTYIDQLTGCLLKAGVEFELIHFSYSVTETTLATETGYKTITIPLAKQNKGKDYYGRNVAYTLAEYILCDRDTEPVFHLNFMNDDTLIRHLKKVFRCKILLVSHYTNWSFSLLGDYTRLKKILNKRNADRDDFEKSVAKSVQEEKKVANRVDKLVCIAQHSSDYFHEMCGVTAPKSEIVSNALKDVYKPWSSARKKKTREKYLLGENTPLVFFAGRLDKVKGIEDLIGSFKKVLKTKPDAYLFIAGEGDYTTWISMACDCWSRIVFTGKLDKKQLYEFYNIADIGIVSSLHEEFGYVAIEMMMHALPVIVSDTGGLSEIVQDGISGFKVPLRNLNGERRIKTDKLALSIIRLLDNRGLAATLGNNGRKRFLEKYEISLFSEKMIRIYNTL